MASRSESSDVDLVGVHELQQQQSSQGGGHLGYAFSEEEGGVLSRTQVVRMEYDTKPQYLPR